MKKRVIYCLDMATVFVLGGLGALGVSWYMESGLTTPLERLPPTMLILGIATVMVIAAARVDQLHGGFSGKVYQQEVLHVSNQT